MTTTTRLTVAAVPALLLLATSCARVDTKSEFDVKPIEVKPIHITVDVNVRIDRELDQFFAFQEDTPATKPAATTAPTTAQTGNSL